MTLDVPEQAYSRATLGVYEMTRVELLRDLYVWAYERSTQEYLATKQDLSEPDSLRLAWRDFIKQAIREVVTHRELEPFSCIQRSVAERVPEGEQAGVQALIVEEFRRLHKGVLARTVYDRLSTQHGRRFMGIDGRGFDSGFGN